MKRASTIFFQMAVVFIGIDAFAFLLWEPQIEGRNAHAALFEIYFKDPFLAYVYIGSIPFFMALYQAFKLLGYVEQNKVFTPNSARALRTIKYCALTSAGFVAGAEIYIFIVQRGKDDIAGGVVMGLFIIFITVIIAAADMFEGLLRAAVDIKSGKVI